MLTLDAITRSGVRYTFGPFDSIEISGGAIWIESETPGLTPHRGASSEMEELAVYNTVHDCWDVRIDRKDVPPGTSFVTFQVSPA